LASASRVSGRTSLSTIKSTPRTHWKHLKFEQGICMAWLVRKTSFAWFEHWDTLCHVRDLFRRSGLFSMYSIRNDHAILRFASEKDSWNKR
jgi:hypothetical protein